MEDNNNSKVSRVFNFLILFISVSTIIMFVLTRVLGNGKPLMLGVEIPKVDVVYFMLFGYVSLISVILGVYRVFSD